MQACFSPSVPVAVRKLWGTHSIKVLLLWRRLDVYEVKHGGTLTHTDIDFRNAEFFFCDGMNDPWLKQYVP